MIPVNLRFTVYEVLNLSINNEEQVPLSPYIICDMGQIVNAIGGNIGHNPIPG